MQSFVVYFMPAWVSRCRGSQYASHLIRNDAQVMMTSSNGNIFRVTGPLCGEFTGPGEFPSQRPVTRSFDVFFDLPLNKRLSKQPWGWWFETPAWSLWRHRNLTSLWRIEFPWANFYMIISVENLRIWKFCATFHWKQVNCTCTCKVTLMDAGKIDQSQATSMHTRTVLIGRLRKMSVTF